MSRILLILNTGTVIADEDRGRIVQLSDLRYYVTGLLRPRLLQDWILELASNINRTQQENKCGYRFENPPFKPQAKHKNNL
jgi:hypothetical protein